MLEEIREQPRALERTLGAELNGVEELRRRLSSKRPNLIVLAARGTSDNAATVRPIPSRDHNRHPCVAGCALGRHAVQGRPCLQGRARGRHIAVG
jgi:hypothetical protein